MDYDAVRHRFLPMTESCFYILLSLQQPRHGYGILQHVRMLTQGRVLLGAGTLYQTLGKLEAAGLIQPAGQSERKKFYDITPAGRRLLREEAYRIAELYRNSAALR